MAGAGKRTGSLGEFKPFIVIHGRKIIFWFLLSIINNIREGDKLVFITTRQYAERYNYEIELKKIIEELSLLDCDHQIIYSEQITRGPAATVLLAQAHCEPDCVTVVANCDQSISFDLSKTDGLGQKIILPTYCNYHQKSSYVEIKDGRVIKIVEKKNISNIASAGIFVVPTSRDLFSCLKKHIDECNGEPFVGPALNLLINKGVEAVPLEVSAKYDLGSPEGIKRFSNGMEKLKLLFTDNNESRTD